MNEVFSCFFIYILSFSSLSAQEGIYLSLDSALKNPLDVKELYIFEKNITAIPSDVDKLSNLEHLDITETSIITIPVELYNLKNLKILRIGWGKLEYLPDGIGKYR